MKTGHEAISPWADTFFSPLEGQNLVWIFSNIRLSRYDGLSKSVAFVQDLSILQIRMDQTGDHMKTNFDYFQIQ